MSLPNSSQPSPDHMKTNYLLIYPNLTSFAILKALSWIIFIQRIPTECFSNWTQLWILNSILIKKYFIQCRFLEISKILLVFLIIIPDFICVFWGKIILSTPKWNVFTKKERQTLSGVLHKTIYRCLWDACQRVSAFPVEQLIS